MEKLTLQEGKFVPSPAESGEARLARLETYVARLSEELEYLLSEVDRAVRETVSPSGKEV